MGSRNQSRDVIKKRQKHCAAKCCHALLQPFSWPIQKGYAYPSPPACAWFCAVIDVELSANNTDIRSKWSGIHRARAEKCLYAPVPCSSASRTILGLYTTSMVSCTLVWTKSISRYAPAWWHTHTRTHQIDPEACHVWEVEVGTSGTLIA